MTRAEAFKRLEQMYDFCARAMDADKNYPLKGDAEAIKVALWAMAQDRSSHIAREQVEKMRGEWVQVAYELAHLKCSECNHSINRFYGVSEFCPSCGAPMTDKAVDILWKRLEAMHNAD